MAQRQLGAEVPEFRQKFPVLLGAPVVPEAQIWNSKKICLGSPLEEVHPLRGPGRGVPWVQIMENELECLGDRRGHDGH